MVLEVALDPSDRVRSVGVLDRKPWRLSFAIIVEISQSLWDIGIAPVAFLPISGNSMRSVGKVGWAQMVQRMVIGGMMKKILVSVVDDDQFCRESMCRLMRSLGHTVDIFSSAAEFLASPRLAETACLIADIHMPAMTGLELYRRLVDTGHAIPTILVTAFPNHVDQARALNDGVMCYLRKPVDEEQLTRCVREALRPADPPEEEP